MLAPLPPACERVQFQSALSDKEYAQLADLLQNHPNVGLRTYGHRGVEDLEFLRFFPTLRHFSATAVYNLTSIDGLRCLPDDLQSLAIGRTAKQLPLDGLARFTSLKKLFIEGQRKGIEVLATLRMLEDLTLRSITLPDLSLLTGLDRLWSLDLKLGGTTDLDLLPEIGRLRYLELWMVRGLSDISAVSNLTDLEVLFLEALKNVTELPDLSRCASLRHVHLATMKGLHDLRPLVQAPALKSLRAGGMPQLQPTDFACLGESPTLVQVHAGLGSKRKNDAVAAVLGALASAWDGSLTEPTA